MFWGTKSFWESIYHDINTNLTPCFWPLDTVWHTNTASPQTLPSYGIDSRTMADVVALLDHKYACLQIKLASFEGTALLALCH